MYDPVADRNAQLLGEQIRIVAVVGEPEIDQHRLAARAIQHVGRLEVEMDDVLPVQVVQRERQRRAQARDFLGRQSAHARPSR